MNYICRIPTLEELVKKQDYEMEHSDDKDNWKVWKEKAISNFENQKTIPYYGFLNGEIISEATAAIDKNVIQNSMNLVKEKTVYLYAFRTIEEYQGKGYFSKLFHYMIEDLKKRGYQYATVGVEPKETKNKEIYQKLGFTTYLGTFEEEYPDGSKIEVEYYQKDLEKE